MTGEIPPTDIVDALRRMHLIPHVMGGGPSPAMMWGTEQPIIGERLTGESSWVRVIPPGPIVPRIASIANGSARLAGIAVSIEGLARPGDLTALLDGATIGGFETRCVDASLLTYEVRLHIPEEMKAGVHEIQLMAGRRTLAPFVVEIE